MKFTKTQMLHELVLCYEAQGYDIWRQIFPYSTHINLADWILMQEILKEEFNSK